MPTNDRPAGGDAAASWPRRLLALGRPGAAAATDRAAGAGHHRWRRS